MRGCGVARTRNQALGSGSEAEGREIDLRNGYQDLAMHLSSSRGAGCRQPHSATSTSGPCSAASLARQPEDVDEIVMA
jgi:hypothetical protein